MRDDVKQASYYQQLDSLASGVLEVDSDVNEDEKREWLLDSSLSDFLTEQGKTQKAKQKKK